MMLQSNHTTLQPLPRVLFGPKFLLLGLMFIALGSWFTPLHAQVWPSETDYTRADLNWRTLETAHFRIHFHANAKGEGSNRTAQVVARIAEDVYAPITALYQHEPDSKVEFILKDYEDYSNGAAYFFDNKIEIWAPALDTPLRGEHNWLRNVITHEFTHIIQVQKTMRTNRALPFLYLQYLRYENVRRPDVLYGYPNLIASYPLLTINNPAWFAEGTAQYQRAGLHYDTWDSHRDMLLRTQFLGEKAFSLAEMGSFLSKTSLGRESVYNHGFAFTRYLAQRFGEDVLRRISEALARHSNVEGAIEAATGISGTQVHREWVHDLTTAYTEATREIRNTETPHEVIEPKGFFNFFPRWSPDGKRIAYLSNKGYDFSSTALVIRDKNTQTAVTIPGVQTDPESFGYTCSHGQVIKPGVSGAFSWHPDGQHIVLSRTLDTPNGHLNADLFLLEVQTKKWKRLTNQIRAAAPTFSPDGKQVAFIRQGDGTTNLALLTLADRSIRNITTFADGRQVLDVQWQGDWLYFTMSAQGNADVYRMRPDGTELTPLIATPHEDKNPTLDPSGQTLYFSSDASGIFNVYRLPVADARAIPDLSTAEPVTNLSGGAFQPAVSASGALLFSAYQTDGYHIARIVQPKRVNVPAYDQPAPLVKTDPDTSFNWATLNAADDRQVQPLSTTQLKQKQGTKPYEPSFSKFSFFPVLRVDDYNSPARTMDAELQRSAAENVLRATKAGGFVSVREVLDGVDLIGGILVAPASVSAGTVQDFLAPSRWRRLERDAQVSVAYNRGFGFLPKRWAPRLVLDVYNIQRIVPNGLTIEEFPCTACYPENSYADLTYTLWEFNLSAHSKINRALAATVGYKVSPYQVRTEAFYSREFQQSISASTSRYFNGRGLSAQLNFEHRKPNRFDHLVSQGLRAQLALEHMPSQLLDRYDIQNGLLTPVYAHYTINRIGFEGRYSRITGYWQQAPHGLDVKVKGSFILGAKPDDFFNDYFGGLIGARGYPFYAVGGTKGFWLNAGYTFPLYTRFKRQIGWLTPDKLYGRVYADAALGWDDWNGFGETRKDAGAELRLSLGSFYLFPTALFVSSTYGFDQFDYQLRNRLTTSDGKTYVTYGHQWLWHFGILFNFD